ncbi:hypothetical protein BOTU111921_03210 [Bordetella tumbae]
MTEWAQSRRTAAPLQSGICQFREAHVFLHWLDHIAFGSACPSTFAHLPVDKISDAREMRVQ